VNLARLARIRATHTNNLSATGLLPGFKTWGKMYFQGDKVFVFIIFLKHNFLGTTKLVSMNKI